MITWTVSVWSQVEVPFESPIRQADMASSSVTLTHSFSALYTSSYLLCALPRLWNLFSSLLFFLWFCAVSCLILHFSDLFSSLSHTAFYCFVVLSSIKQGEHVIVLTTHPLCATAPEALSQQRILEEYEHRAKGKDKWIFNKQKQAGWLTEKCGFYNRKPDTSVLQSIQTQARGSACTVPPLKFRLLYSSKVLTSDSSWDFI